MNGLMKASVSPGSSQRAASVTWSPHVIVPSGAADTRLTRPASVSSRTSGRIAARTRRDLMQPPEWLYRFARGGGAGAGVSDDARPAQLVDLRLRNLEERRQNLVRVLAEQRRRRLRRARRLPKADGHAHSRDRARLGMRHAHEHAASA